MRYLTADYICPLHEPPIKKGVLQVSDSGEIIEVHRDYKKIKHQKTEVFSGIICPGFINAHCHLELSHLRGVIPRRTGLVNFIQQIYKRNNFNDDFVQEAIDLAEKEMINNGIVAVGDICNTTDTILQKKKQNLTYYNFIEVFEVNSSNINKKITNALAIRDEFINSNLTASLTPHALYSNPPLLIRKILESNNTNETVFTVHNQESDSENQLFELKKGELFSWLKSIKADSNIWNTRDNNSDIINDFLEKKIILVHNTYIKKKDIRGVYYCTCPSANLYIENKLPDYSLFDRNKLCVGTDSLASNTHLSILNELLIIKENTDFDLNTLLKIASKNGAEALGLSQFGTFEKGKKPGVNLLSVFQNHLTNSSKITVLQ